MNVYKSRLLKKSWNQKLKLILSTLVTTLLSNIAFHLLPIWLQTLVAIDSESRLTSFPSFCVQPIEVAVLFHSNVSRHPFFGQFVDLDLLLCKGLNSEHVVLFLCHIFTQRPMTERKIEQSYGRNFGWVRSRISLLLFHRNFHFTWKQKVTCSCPKFTKH